MWYYVRNLTDVVPIRLYPPAGYSTFRRAGFDVRSAALNDVRFAPANRHHPAQASGPFRARS